jgi:Na+/proline symporter
MPAGTQVGSLFVQVGVAGFAEVGRVFDSVENRMKATADRLQSIGGRLSAAVTVPLVGLGIASVQSAGQMQAMTRSLEAIMGSAEGAASERGALGGSGAGLHRGDSERGSPLGRDG